MRLLRLTLATTTVGGLALTTGLAGVPAAHAVAPLDTASFTITASPYSAGDCSTVPAPTGVNTSIAAGDTLTRSVTLSGTATSAGDSSDTVALHGTQKVTVSSTAAGGQLTSLTIGSTISGTVTASKGAASSCTTSSEGTGWNFSSGLQGTVHRTTAGWLHLGVHSAGVGGQGAGVQLASSGGSVLLQSQVGALALRDVDDDQWVYVPAGDYHLQTTVLGAAATYPAFPKASLAASITMRFFPAGIAKAAESGTARPMVTFPSRLTCATGKAAVTLTSTIKGAASVALLVDGATTKTIKHPGAAKVSLGVPTNQGVTLKAVVHKSGTTLSASRSYRAC